jgi:hypothetical protein
VYVAEKVKDHRFKIAGGRAGLEVCWAVTGVRHDPWAEANRVPVEEDKTGADRGRLLAPEAYGRPASDRVAPAAAQPVAPAPAEVRR